MKLCSMLPTVAICLSLVFAGAASGQVPAEQVICPPHEVSTDHWSLEALRRLEAMGRISVQSSERTLSTCRIHELLEGAMAGSEGEEELSQYVSGLLQRLEGETGRWNAVRDPSVLPLLTSASVAIGLEDRSGAAAPGLGEFVPERTGALPLVDRTEAAALASTDWRLVRGVWAGASAGLYGDKITLDRAEVIAVAGPMLLTVGRGDVGFGYSRGGAIVLSRALAVDRIDVSLFRPARLPGPLRLAGPVTFSTFLGRFREARHPENPFFWGATATVRPHPRTTVAIHRAAMFRGDNGNFPLTPRSVLSMLAGGVGGTGFEDQIVSVELVMRLPTEAVLPITAYLDWGAEDAAGAWWDVPGRIAGVYFPLLPGLRTATVNLEYSSFSRSCCGNPEWYRHWSFPGSWVSFDQPLGHPLGGNGSEILAVVDGQLRDSRLRWEGRAFIRDRDVQNLYVPGREGKSSGIAARASWSVLEQGELDLRLSNESGDGWSERQVRFRFLYHL